MKTNQICVWRNKEHCITRIWFLRPISISFSSPVHSSVLTIRPLTHSRITNFRHLSSIYWTISFTINQYLSWSIGAHSHSHRLWKNLLYTLLNLLQNTISFDIAIKQNKSIQATLKKKTICGICRFQKTASMIRLTYYMCHSIQMQMTFIGK